jgi:ABC-type transport system involved in cytochrome bd biosynthesis fused ATPase/permease subunit
VRDATLVILDEPTVDLDRASAEVIAEAIERLRLGRTVLLIAHRPEFAVWADRVVVLEGGKVVIMALEQNVLRLQANTNATGDGSAISPRQHLCDRR